MSFLKNTAGQSTLLVVIDTDGLAKTSGVDFYVALDNGAQAALSGTAVHRGNGQWYIPLSQAETNADSIGIVCAGTGVVPNGLVILTGSDISAEIAALDVIADAIKAKTDSLTFTVAGKVDATADGAGLTAGQAEQLDDLATNVDGKLSEIWSQAGVVDGVSPAKILAVLAAVAAGTTEGFGEATIKFKDLNKILNRVTVTRDSTTKNRLVTLLDFSDFA